MGRGGGGGGGAEDATVPLAVDATVGCGGRPPPTTLLAVRIGKDALRGRIMMVDRKDDDGDDGVAFAAADADGIVAAFDEVTGRAKEEL